MWSVIEQLDVQQYCKYCRDDRPVYLDWEGSTDEGLSQVRVVCTVCDHGLQLFDFGEKT